LPVKSVAKKRGTLRVVSAVLLCVAGFVLARATPFRETTVVVDAGGCRLVTDISDAGDDTVQGSVILLHGLAANRKIMSYLARGFAMLNLRVFVPDMPGHGRTPGPFSFARAEACSDSFMRQLIARRAIDPTRTILAGHSMGGAIAVRIGARVPVAGVILASPAPMVTTYGVPASLLPFRDPPATAANTLVLSASAEPAAVRDSARSLISGSAEATGKYMVIPHSTHVSLLFDPAAAYAAQAWAGKVLKLDANPPALPSRIPLAGSLAGLGGILLLAGPFLRETVGMKTIRASGGLEAAMPTNTAGLLQEPGSPIIVASFGRVVLEVAIASMVIVAILRVFSQAAKIFALFHVFEGDYLAGFLLTLGSILLLAHWKHLGIFRDAKPATLLAAGFAAFVLPLLIYSWLDLTVSEAWLTSARWLRLPALCLAALPYHAAEELLLGPPRARPAKARFALAVTMRLAAWAALLLGVFVLHNGEILLVLLAPYLAMFSLLQRQGMDVVRNGTGSPLAAALFGAILLAGFSVVVFPIT
jgi:pimeloyl-ACP methyl ester carboxylesterase